jgi:hypothetical protein
MYFQLDTGNAGSKAGRSPEKSRHFTIDIAAPINVVVSRLIDFASRSPGASPAPERLQCVP